MEQTKEHKERNKGGRPKKEATEKLSVSDGTNVTMWFCSLKLSLCHFKMSSLISWLILY